MTLERAQRSTMNTDFELRLHRRMSALRSQFKDGHDAAKAPRAALRAGTELLAAEEGCVAILPPDSEQPQIMFAVPRDSKWDLAFLTAFIRGQKISIPGNLALGRLRRRGRLDGVIAVRSHGAEFHWDAREGLSAIADVASEIGERREVERIREVRARLDCKLMEQLRPKDLFYQILHGLRSLTDYDHSAALLIHDRETRALVVTAEQIAWQKGKSERIGLNLPLDDYVCDLLKSNIVYGFDRAGDSWQAWTGGESLAQLLDFNAGKKDPSQPRESSLLCAPLVTRDGLLGVLKVAATRRHALAPYEANLVSQFLPQVSIALQISHRTTSLEQKVIAAHRKHAMADLARGVAHDVNNALGAILPLVQQMRVDVGAGRVEPSVIADDLGQIEQSVQICRRIFGGMLSFARGAARNVGQASVRQAIECARTILKDGLQRSGIQTSADIATDAQAVHGVQADLDQLLLNLLTNSRDAMPKGGNLTVRARRLGGILELVVEDSGGGISPEHLAKVQEPFFTTKENGSGLGLSICRSIVWQMRGTLDIESKLGEGTRVIVKFPAYQAGT